MEILASRFLLRPRELERSIAFYRDVLGLAVFREWGSGPSRGVVFFLGNGLLEVSGRSDASEREKLQLWLQVRDVAAAQRELAAAGVEIAEPPAWRPWGLIEMLVRDPDGVGILVVEVPDDHPLRRRQEDGKRAPPTTPHPPWGE